MNDITMEIEMTIAISNLKIAMKNKSAVDRKIKTDAEREATCKELWVEMAKENARTRKAKSKNLKLALHFAI